MSSSHVVSSSVLIMTRFKEDLGSHDRVTFHVSISSVAVFTNFLACFTAAGRLVSSSALSEMGSHLFFRSPILALNSLAGASAPSMYSQSSVSIRSDRKLSLSSSVETFSTSSSSLSRLRVSITKLSSSFLAASFSLFSLSFSSSVFIVSLNLSTFSRVAVGTCSLVTLMASLGRTVILRGFRTVFFGFSSSLAFPSSGAPSPSAALPSPASSWGPESVLLAAAPSPCSASGVLSDAAFSDSTSGAGTSTVFSTSRLKSALLNSIRLFASMLKNKLSLALAASYLSRASRTPVTLQVAMRLSVMPGGKGPLAWYSRETSSPLSEKSSKVMDFFMGSLLCLENSSFTSGADSVPSSLTVLSSSW
mmetsp:Transcript_32751/g.91721  ORF Transcript_32751/g.91721 Transcript_32751/m.91721 type:complete len:363 (-) Transcript_32751:1244-2332(-)